MFDEIKELKSLLDEGLITQEDYNRKKAELLNHKEGIGGSAPKERKRGNNPAASKVVAKISSGFDKVKTSLMVLIVVAAITFVLGVSHLVTAYDKIDNYYNSESYPSINENAYVGGDAYNYIINGTYFTGYAVQGMGYLLISALSGMFALKLYLVSGNPRGKNSTQKPDAVATEPDIPGKPDESAGKCDSTADVLLQSDGSVATEAEE